jgi:hypothetical protein
MATTKKADEPTAPPPAPEPAVAEGEFLLTSASTDQVALAAALAALPYFLARVPNEAIGKAIQTGEAFAAAWDAREEHSAAQEAGE